MPQAFLRAIRFRSNTRCNRGALQLTERVWFSDFVAELGMADASLHGRAKALAIGGEALPTRRPWRALGRRSGIVKVLVGALARHQMPHRDIWRRACRRLVVA